MDCRLPGRGVDRALADSGIDDAALAREMADCFVADRARRHVVFPESRAVLEHLRGRVKLGMITNGASDIQRRKIEGSGLAGYFDVILVSGEEGFGKPKKEIFRLAIDRLDVDEASAVMIGDSLARDIAGAASVGIKSVWVNRFGRKAGEQFPAPDIEMADLAGLPPCSKRFSSSQLRDLTHFFPPRADHSMPHDSQRVIDRAECGEQF